MSAPSLGKGRRPRRSWLMTAYSEELGEYLADLKQRSGRSYEWIGRKVNAGKSTVQRYCTGYSVPAEFGTIERIARVCGANNDEVARLFRLWERALRAAVEGINRTTADTARKKNPEDSEVPELPEAPDLPEIPESSNVPDPAVSDASGRSSVRAVRRWKQRRPRITVIGVGFIDITHRPDHRGEWPTCPASIRPGTPADHRTGLGTTGEIRPARPVRCHGQQCHRNHAVL